MILAEASLRPSRPESGTGSLHSFAVNPPAHAAPGFCEDRPRTPARDRPVVLAARHPTILRTHDPSPSRPRAPRPHPARRRAGLRPLRQPVRPRRTRTPAARRPSACASASASARRSTRAPTSSSGRSRTRTTSSRPTSPSRRGQLPAGLGAAPRTPARRAPQHRRRRQPARRPPAGANPFLTSEVILAEGNLMYYLAAPGRATFAPYLFTGLGGLFATGDAAPGVTRSHPSRSPSASAPRSRSRATSRSTARRRTASA